MEDYEATLRTFLRVTGLPEEQYLVGPGDMVRFYPFPATTATYVEGKVVSVFRDNTEVLRYKIHIYACAGIDWLDTDSYAFPRVNGYPSQWYRNAYVVKV
jgi:hypothetical protein